MPIWAIVGAVLCTLVVVTVAINLHVPEKRLKHIMEHLYGITDPQFNREMSVLGPGHRGGQSHRGASERR